MSEVLTAEGILRAKRFWDGFTPDPHRYVCQHCREVMPSIGDYTQHAPDCPVGKALREVRTDGSA